MRSPTLGLSLLALAMLASCSQATPTATLPKPTPAPSSTSAPPTPFLLPRNHTPKPSLGVVVGTLWIGEEPAGGQTMYLAEVIQPQGDSSMGVAALDPVNDPRVESDASGYFVFLDVEPGQYGLGIMSPGGPVLVRGDDSREILANVEAGKTVALGDVHIVPFGQQ